jgi:hypothetical protein
VINKRLVLLNPNYQAPKRKEEARLASAPGIQRRQIGSQRTQRNSRLQGGDMVFSADNAKNLMSEGKKQALSSKDELLNDKTDKD